MRLQLEDIELAFEDRGGGGLPLVCLHGLTGNQSSWDCVADELTKRYNLFTYDHRGHGHSGHSPGNYTIEILADDAANFISHVVGEPALVWGHSMGACTALRLAFDRPELVRAIVLEDPPMESGIKNKDFLSILKFWQELGRKKLSEEAMVEALSEKYGEEDIENHRYKAKSLKQMDISMIQLALDGNLWTRAEALNFISNIRCPAFFLQADFEQGGLIDEDLSKLTELQAENWTWKRYPGIAHNLHSLAPEMVTCDVVEFFSIHLP